MEKKAMFSLIGAHVTALKAAQPLRGGVTLRDDVSEEVEKEHVADWRDIGANQNSVRL